MPTDSDPLDTSPLSRALDGTAGTTLTPFHLLVLLLGAGVLLLSQLDLDLDLDFGRNSGIKAGVNALCEVYALPAGAGAMGPRALMRAAFLLVLALLGYQAVVLFWGRYEGGVRAKLGEMKRGTMDLEGRSEMKRAKDAWANDASHPAAFLTTTDGKPRIWPFPLGRAGGVGTKDLWWEAGNAVHVGHFKRNETPEAREQLRLEMEDKERERAKKAKEVLDEIEAKREKWMSRMTNLKIVGSIVVIGLLHKPAGAVCLAALIYYLLAKRLHAMLALPPPGDKDEDEYPALKRKKIPLDPGVGMTYIYDPTDGGGLEPGMAIPIRAPAHRLMTTTDSRYAS